MILKLKLKNEKISELHLKKIINQSDYFNNKIMMNLNYLIILFLIILIIIYFLHH